MVYLVGCDSRVNAMPGMEPWARWARRPGGPSQRYRAFCLHLRKKRKKLNWKSDPESNQYGNHPPSIDQSERQIYVWADIPHPNDENPNPCRDLRGPYDPARRAEQPSQIPQAVVKVTFGLGSHPCIPSLCYQATEPWRAVVLRNTPCLRTSPPLPHHRHDTFIVSLISAPTLITNPSITVAHTSRLNHQRESPYLTSKGTANRSWLTVWSPSHPPTRFPSPVSQSSKTTSNPSSTTRPSPSTPSSSTM